MTLELEGVLETAIYVDDLPAAEAFYNGILGMPVILRRDGAHIFFRCGHTVLLAFKPDVTRVQTLEDGPYPVPAHGADGAGHICFTVPEGQIDNMARKLTDAGIEIESDFQWHHGVRSVYVRDPAGNSVEFAEAALWEERA